MRHRLLAAVAAALLLWMTGACGRRPERVVFGVGMASNTHDAVRLAAREINASGGIGGVPLVLDGLDWQGYSRAFDPATVLALADRFVKNPQVLAVVGHSDSASTLTAASVYNAGGVPHVVTIATNPAITGIGQWTYRMCVSDASQGPALADYAVTHWRKRRMAVIYVNDEYGSGLAERFERRARELGAAIVATATHRNILQADDERAIRLIVARLKREVKPDLVVLFQRVSTALWTLRALQEAGLAVDVLGGDNLAQYALVEQTRLSEGIRISLFYAPDPTDPRAVRFEREYRTLTGEAPDYSQAFAYDAVYLLRDAVLHGGYSRARVKRYLDGLVANQVTVPGVGGPFRFGPDHDGRRNLFVAEVRGGQLAVIQAMPVN